MRAAQSRITGCHSAHSCPILTPLRYGDNQKAAPSYVNTLQ